MCGSVVDFFLPGVDVPAVSASTPDCRHVRSGRPARRRPRAASSDSSAGSAGHDCVVEVGLPEPSGDATVVAIIDLGRHLSYGVFTTADPDAPAFLVGKRIYAVTEFA